MCYNYYIYKYTQHKYEYKQISSNTTILKYLNQSNYTISKWFPHKWTFGMDYNLKKIMQTFQDEFCNPIK